MTLSTLYGVFAVMFLGALCSGQLAVDDFRIVNRHDLVASDSDLFEDKSTKSFSQLLFDVARDQVIVGARDALYRLSLRALRVLERADWAAPDETRQACQDKGQTEEDCHNYVKVLLAHGHRLFACGTNAFSPLCSWRELESIGNVSQWVTGVAKSPCNPRSNVTALLAGGGDYYVGTPTDFSGSDKAICRSQGAASQDLGTVRTTQYDLSWLNEPQFVGSFEDDRFVYFVFREVAVEFMACGKAIYSRIARVCKNDPGGHLQQGVGVWSTFLKARLTCSEPGDLAFNYDEVQGMEYLPEENLIVATFTTNSNSIAGSALCVYNMSDVREAFDGHYAARDGRRPPAAGERAHYACEYDSRYPTQDYRYQLMYDAIRPVFGEPVYRATLQRFTHVTVDVTSTMTGRQVVAYVATAANDVLKLAVWPRLNGACLAEVLRLSNATATYDVGTMQFVKETMSLYLGGNDGVLRVSGERCARHIGRASCLRAADPHCAWDDAADACVRARPQLLSRAVDECPSNREPVDGGWSQWAEWASCAQHSSERSPYSEQDSCLCRARRCDSPRPERGGRHCDGASIEVANCTVHGGWSAWSCWSECSAPCGIAVRTRHRSCSAPQPRFGGRVCVGTDTQDAMCATLPPCPDPTLAVVDGGWSAWGPWSVCTSAGGPGCGPAGGWRERRRNCTNPTPRHGGMDCEGSRIDRQICDMKPCEVRKATAWTPWVQIPGNNSDGSYMEKRFKFLCKAPSPEQIRLSIAREEERYCSATGVCGPQPDEGSWEPWGAWGACSAACAGGQQARSRRCRRPPCHGPKEMLRLCNTHACSGEWSCWSEWSECSGTCGSGRGTGHRTRTRLCLSPEGCADAGAALERRPCIAACGESETGWSEWGDWTSCDNGERLRRRECASETCAGTQIQVARDDARDDVDNELYAMPAYSASVVTASFGAQSDGGLSIGSVVGCAIAAFLMGCLCCLLGVVFWQRRGSRLPWGRGARVPSSPHYITAKQNSYVTVPLKEVPRKAKRQPSFSGISSSSGILLKSNNIATANNHNSGAPTPKLYPKAIASEYETMGTLRRHSNQPNHKNNFDVEEDKFY